METKYTLGRILAGVMIAGGWVAAAIGCAVLIVSGFMSKGGNPILTAVAGVLGAGILGALNHGAWQALVALFDIADAARATSVTAGLQLEQLRAANRTVHREEVARPPPTPGEVWAPPPPQQQPPLPPVDLPNGPRPGETPDAWAKRIEREEADAFRRRQR